MRAASAMASTLAFEHDMEGLLAEMRRRGRSRSRSTSPATPSFSACHGKNHPLATYLAAGVPVVISTDDAGVSRINMTNEYFRAVHDQGLGYPTLKAIARNALTYSFLDETQKRSELERFDRSYIEFERSLARQQSALQNLIVLIKAALLRFELTRGVSQRVPPAEAACPPASAEWSRSDSALACSPTPR